MMKKLIFTLSLSLLAATGFSQTTVDAAYCGNTLTSSSANFFAVPVSGATRYAFKFVNGGDTYITERSTVAMRMQLNDSLNYGTTYAVSVATKMGAGAWSAYGAPCNITTAALFTAPGINMLGANPRNLSTFGAAPVSSQSGNIFCTDIDNAYTYKFTWTQYTDNSYTVPSGTPDVVVYRNQNVIRGELSPGLQYNKFYKLNAEWYEYGDDLNLAGNSISGSINVSTPTTSTITDLNCGNTVALNTNIFSSQVVGAPHYKFKLEVVSGAAANAAGFAGHIIYVVRPNNWIRFNLVDSLVYGLPYAITTAIEVAPGVYGDFDNVACTITAPPAPTSTLVNCPQTLASMNDYVTATPVSGAQRYRFIFTDNGTSVSDTLSRANNTVKAAQVVCKNGMRLSYGTGYSVVISWQDKAGNWHDGTGCTLTTPTAVGVTTQLTAGDCSGSFAMNAPMHANNVPGATYYRFTLTNTSTGLVYTRVISNTQVRPNQVPGLTTNGTYDVTVEWQDQNTSGTWFSAGATCTITITGGAPAFAINNGPVGNMNTKSGELNGNSFGTAIGDDLNINVYPNPTIGFATLEANAVIENVEIYALDGKLVYTAQPNQSRVNLDLSELNTGVYVVRSYANGIFNTTKLVKK